MSSSHVSSSRCLIQFLPEAFPEVIQDRSEKIRNVCLWGLHKTFGVKELSNGYHPAMEKTNCLAAFLFGLMTFTILLPITLIGLAAHCCSQSHKQRYTKHVTYLAANPLPNRAISPTHSPKNPSPPKSPTPAPLTSVPQDLVIKTLQLKTEPPTDKTPPITMPPLIDDGDKAPPADLKKPPQEAIRKTKSKALDKLKASVAPSILLANLLVDHSISAEDLSARLKELLPQLHSFKSINFLLPDPDDKNAAPLTYHRYFQIVGPILDKLKELNPREKTPEFHLLFNSHFANRIQTHECLFQYLTLEQFQTLASLMTESPNWWNATLNASLLHSEDMESALTHENRKIAIEGLTDAGIIDCMLNDKYEGHAKNPINQQLFCKWLECLKASERLDAIVGELFADESEASTKRKTKFFQKFYTSFVSLKIGDEITGTVSTFINKTMPLIKNDYSVLDLLIPSHPTDYYNETYRSILFGAMSTEQSDHYIEQYGMHRFDIWQAACSLQLLDKERRSARLNSLLKALPKLFAIEMAKGGFFKEAVESLRKTLTKNEHRGLLLTITDLLSENIPTMDLENLLNLAVITKKLDDRHLFYNMFESWSPEQFKSVLDDMNKLSLSEARSGWLPDESPLQVKHPGRSKEIRNACFCVIEQLACSAELSPEDLTLWREKFQVFIDFLQEVLLEIPKEVNARIVADGMDPKHECHYANTAPSFRIFEKMIFTLDKALLKNFMPRYLEEIGTVSESNPLRRTRAPLNWRNLQVNEYLAFMRSSFETIFAKYQEIAGSSLSVKQSLHQNIPAFLGPIALKSLYAQCITKTEKWPDLWKEDLRSRMVEENCDTKTRMFLASKFINIIGEELSPSAFDAMSAFLTMVNIKANDVISHFDELDADVAQGKYPLGNAAICTYYAHSMLSEKSVPQEAKEKLLADLINRPFLRTKTDWRAFGMKQPVETTMNFGYFLGQLNLPPDVILGGCVQVKSPEKQEEFIAGYLQGVLRKGDSKVMNVAFTKLVELFGSEFLIKIKPKLMPFKAFDKIDILK